MDGIKHIADKIFTQIEEEKEKGALQSAIARIESDFGGVNKIFWFYNKEYQRQSLEKRDINGNLIGYDSSDTAPVRVQTDDGTELSKNSKFGGYIITHRLNPFIYDFLNKEVKVQNFTEYKPVVNRINVDARDGSIEALNSEKVIFNSLRTLLEIQSDAQTKLALEKELEEAKELDQAKILQAKIEEMVSAEKSKLELQQRYIRSSTALRMQPILDPIQEKTKRSKILSGMLVIDGGPGTGKTTTLIQRINFLTSSTIKEYLPDISPDELSQLEQSWRFFSPSRLLKQFLRNSMAEEGLAASDHHLKVWFDYLNEVFKEYGLFQSSNKKGFTKVRKQQSSILPNSASFLSNALLLLENALISEIRKTIENTLTMDISELSWEEDVLDWKKKAEIMLRSNNIHSFVQQFTVWQRDHKDAIADQLRSISKNIELLASKLEVILGNRTPMVLEEIDQYLKVSFEKRNENEEEEDDSDLLIEEQTFNQKFNLTIERSKFFKRIVSNYAQVACNKGIRRSKEMGTWFEKISYALENLNVKEIGELLLFRRFSALFIAGPSRIVFERIPSVYKNTRALLIKELKEIGIDTTAFEQLVTADRSRLHPDEMNLLIAFVNGIARDLLKANKTLFERLEHSFIEGYKNHTQRVIAIDESSDFSLVELNAIASFSHPAYNSVTLSGDLMQRMTKNGVNEWKEVVSFFKDTEIHNLITSYRQSPTLLSIAKRLYKEVTGEEARYVSYLPPSEAEPKPVIVRNRDTSDLVVWLEQQILDLYKIYDKKIPSIAIFVESDNAVEIISKALSDSDTLNDVGITVRGSKSDSEIVSTSQICVYNITTIKGLEFEAVFFVNADELAIDDEELLQKYLYVGVSRAAYYLAVSYINELPTSLKFLYEFQEDNDE